MKSINKKILTIILFFIYLILGSKIYKDYGISTDEEFHRALGMYWLKYIFSFFPNNSFNEILSLKINSLNDPTLPNPEIYSFYGIIFDLPLAFIELIFNINDSFNYFYLRHYFTFLIFFLSSVFFFRIIYFRFNDWFLSIIGTLLYVLSPRIFAESFYNNKDIIFLSLFTISLFFVLKYFKNLDTKNSIILGIFIAISSALRILGILVIINFVIFFLLKILSNFKKYFHEFKFLLILLIFFYLFLILIYPYLWKHPFVNFINAIKIFSRYPHDIYILYFGNYIKSSNVPWHYFFVWFFITTPLIYSTLFLLGFFYCSIRFFKRLTNISIVQKNHNDLWRSVYEKYDLFIYFLLLLILFLVIKLNATLYDGWRQLYFLHVIVVYFCIYALNFLFLFYKKKIRYIYIFLISYLSFIMLDLYKKHPFQNLYFNEIVNFSNYHKNLEEKFVIDYWGLTNKHALLKILDFEKKDTIYVANASYNTLFRSLAVLEKTQRVRFEIVGQNYLKADYIVNDFNSEVNKKINKKYSIPHNFKLFFTFYNNKIKIYEIYKRS